jgi:hypothetical protein
MQIQSDEEMQKLPSNKNLHNHSSWNEMEILNSCRVCSKLTAQVLFCVTQESVIIGELGLWSSLLLHN